MKDLNFYRALPYLREWEGREDAGQFYMVVHLKQIPQVYGYGPTRADALSHLREAFDDYITWRLEEGIDVPEPSGAEASSESRVPQVSLSAPSDVLPGLGVPDSTQNMVWPADQTRVTDGAEHTVERVIDCAKECVAA